MKMTTIPLLASDEDTIEEDSSNEPSASCHEGGTSAPAAHDANYLQEDDLRNGGAWDRVDSVYHDDLRQSQASASTFTDCNLLSGGAKKGKKKNKNKNRAETQENPGPGGWYTPAKQKDDGDFPRSAVPHCHVCFRSFERNEGSLTQHCPKCQRSFSEWNSFCHCPVPQHMRYAVCGQCIEGKQKDEPPAVGVPSDDFRRPKTTSESAPHCKASHGSSQMPSSSTTAATNLKEHYEPRTSPGTSKRSADSSQSKLNPKTARFIQPKKMPVSKFAPINPALPTRIGLSTATSLRHARVRQVIENEPAYMLMGEMRLALGLFPSAEESNSIAIRYVDDPEDMSFEQGVRPEGLYAVLWKQQRIGFEVATFGNEPDHFLVHMRGPSPEQTVRWQYMWGTHLAGFRVDYLHADTAESGLCGWRLIQQWCKLRKWDTSKTLDAKILAKEDREIAFRSKLVWRHAGPEFVKFAATIRGSFLANYDTYPEDDTYWATSGGAPETIEVGSPKANSTTSSSGTKPDPWANYDPWLKRKWVRQSRWEDLELPQDHPFSTSAGVRLQFVRKQELGPAKGGVAFATKSSVPQLVEIKPKELALLLIPQLLQEDPLQNISNLRGLVEVIVVDPALQSSYKRQVRMIVLNQDPKSVIHSLPSPSISLTVADVAELIIDCDARTVSKEQFQSFNDNPIHRFKGIFKEHCEIDFWANSAFYSYKFIKPREGEKHGGIHQCILKVQKAHRIGLLSFSGKNELFVRG